MPGKRYRYQHGPHRVRICGVNAGHGEVIVESTKGINYSAPMKELKPIPQKSTSPTNQKKGSHPTAAKKAQEAKTPTSRKPTRINKGPKHLPRTKVPGPTRSTHARR